MKTVSVALILCLNIGTDPPDVSRFAGSASKICWFDPARTSRAKAKEAIGNLLESQYAKWQTRAKYKQSLDPTVEEVRSLCLTMRRYAKGDRLLFHYNGHGVPRPTSNGEVWVFNKNYTQYIPLSVYDIKAWIGTPSIVVLDCSNAGVLLPVSFR
jgi:regulator-associated protein of mTOR